MNLHRLIYTSVRKPECTDQEIEKILNSARKNNPKRDITGILLHSEKRFVQYLEGDKDEITELFEQIKTDDRHGGAMVRDLSPIEERVFGSWQMGYRDLSTNKLTFDTPGSDEDKRSFESILNDEKMTGDTKVRILKMFFKQ